MKGGLRITGALSQRYVQIIIIVIIARALTATSKVDKNPTYSLFEKTRVAFYRLKKKEQGRLPLFYSLFRKKFRLFNETNGVNLAYV
jgi:hypothetical protein